VSTEPGAAHSDATKRNSIRRLTDTELDHLSAVLERFGDKRSMNLEQLDGFIAALICGPELVPPSKYLPTIWGD
jgi:uncharacterized protein